MVFVEQLIPSGDLFNATASVRAYVVFKNDLIGRLIYRKVRLGSHDQAERLKFRRDVEFALGTPEDHLTKILGPALRRDGPHDVCKVLATVSVGRNHVIEFHLDLRVSALAFHFRFAVGARLEFRSTKTYRGRTAPIEIINSFCRPL